MMRANGRGGSSTRITIVVTLLVVFTALKVTGVVAWPWLWVLAPLWIDVALDVSFYVLVFVAAIIGSAWDRRAEHR